jgi:hypothetical protein
MSGQRISDEELDNATFEVAPRPRFVVLDPEFMYDTRLDWRAKAILAFLLQHPPDGPKLSMAYLISLGPDGRYANYAAMRRLTEAGYAKRHQTRKAGRLSSTTFTVSWVPDLLEPRSHGDSRPVSVVGDDDEDYGQTKESASSTTSAPCADFLHAEIQNAVLQQRSKDKIKDTNQARKAKAFLAAATREQVQARKGRLVSTRPTTEPVTSQSGPQEGSAPVATPAVLSAGALDPRQSEGRRKVPRETADRRAPANMQAAYVKRCIDAWNTHKRREWTAEPHDHPSKRVLRYLAEAARHYGDRDKAADAIELGVRWAAQREEWAFGKSISFSEMAVNEKLLEYGNKARQNALNGGGVLGSMGDAGGTSASILAHHRTPQEGESWLLRGSQPVNIIAILNPVMFRVQPSEGEPFVAYADDLSPLAASA